MRIEFSFIIFSFQSLAFLFWLHRNAGTSAAALASPSNIPGLEAPSSSSCDFSPVMVPWYQKIPTLMETKIPMEQPPTAKKPFVFFHLRKAGGSTWRKLLFDAAKKLDLTKWVSCEFPTSCRDYILPVVEEKNRAIYAGHLYFADVQNQLSFNGRPWTMHTVADQHPFQCLVSLRPTVERVVSCWNFRFSQKFKKIQPASNLTAEQWQTELANMYTSEKEGCNNEYLRVFGDIADEVRVNTLTSSKLNPTQCAVARTELDIITSRLSHCIITINGRYKENLAIIQHYAPWLAPFFEEKGKKKIMAGKIKENKTLLPGAEEAILSQNRLDEYVYQYGLKVYEKQLEEIGAS